MLLLPRTESQGLLAQMLLLH